MKFAAEEHIAGPGAVSLLLSTAKDRIDMHHSAATKGFRLLGSFFAAGLIMQSNTMKTVMQG